MRYHSQVRPLLDRRGIICHTGMASGVRLRVDCPRVDKRPGTNPLDGFLGQLVTKLLDGFYPGSMIREIVLPKANLYRASAAVVSFSPLEAFQILTDFFRRAGGCVEFRYIGLIRIPIPTGVSKGSARLDTGPGRKDDIAKVNGR